MSFVAGETSSYQTLGQIRNFGDVDWLSIEISSASLFGRKQLVSRGIVNHARDSLPLPLQRQRHAEHGKSVSKVSGSVQRVHIPAIVTTGLYARALFPEHIMLGPTRLDALQNQGLGLPIRHSHRSEERRVGKERVSRW